jgi:hypothetical protein
MKTLTQFLARLAELVRRELRARHRRREARNGLGVGAGAVECPRCRRQFSFASYAGHRCGSVH